MCDDEMGLWVDCCRVLMFNQPKKYEIKIVRAPTKTMCIHFVCFARQYRSHRINNKLYIDDKWRPMLRCGYELHTTIHIKINSNNKYVMLMIRDNVHYYEHFRLENRVIFLWLLMNINTCIQAYQHIYKY